MMTIPHDWREFLSALLSQNTKFLLIGAHALAFHAEGRLTEDLDVFVEPTVENGERILQALQKLGFGGLVSKADEFAVADRVFMLGVKPWRIDILTGIDGVTFDEAWASRLAVNFHGIDLFVIGRDALVRNKRAAGRKKDLVDVALLEETEKP
jgi:hypothetical protein